MEEKIQVLEDEINNRIDSEVRKMKLYCELLCLFIIQQLICNVIKIMYSFIYFKFFFLKKCFKHSCDIIGT